MSPGINKCFNSFFVVSVIIVLSMMKNVQKCCGHCIMIKKKYWTLRNNGLNFKLQNRNAQDSISSRRFTDSVAVQYPGDPGLWDNLEELLAYILCRRTRSNIGQNERSLLLFFNVGQMTEHYSELLFSNFVLPRTYVNIAWMSGSSPSSLLLPSLHLPRRLKCTCCGYFFISGNFNFSFVSTSLA